MLPIRNTDEIKSKISTNNKLQIDSLGSTDINEQLDEIVNDKEPIKNVNISIDKETDKVIMASKNNDITDNFNILEDISKLKTNKKKDFHICVYNKVKHSYPFLTFLLEKDSSGEENMDFLSFTYQKKANIESEIIDYLNKINNDYNTKTLLVKGYITDRNTVIFVEYNAQNNIELLKRNDTYWWTLSFEIISLKKVCNFPVSKNVSSFFINNNSMLYLNKNKQKIPIPISLYFGNYYKNISYVANFGIKRETHKAPVGPFYYFSEYNKAIRYGGWKYVHSNLPSNIETDENERFYDGGIVRFAIFYDNIYSFINHPDDKPDESDIFKQLLEDEEETSFLLSKQTMRDHDGKWTQNNDCAYIGPVKIRESGKRISKHPVFIIKKFEQQYPLSYHKLDIESFPKQFDSNRTDYYIQ